MYYQHLLNVSVSNPCAVVHVFCNVNQDGSQLQTINSSVTEKLKFSTILEEILGGFDFGTVCTQSNISENKSDIMVVKCEIFSVLFFTARLSKF